MITYDKNLNNIVINEILTDMQKQNNATYLRLLKSFIVAVLWTLWLYFWYYMPYVEGETWWIHYFLSTFGLYSILYPPQNCHSYIRSIGYLFTISVIQIINVVFLFVFFVELGDIPLILSALFINFVVVWYAKNNQLKLWNRLKTTVFLTRKDESTIKINQVKLFCFILTGIIFLNLSGLYFKSYGVYYIFPLSQIILSVGYWLYVSENRKWIDRFLDFLALFILNFFSLWLNYSVWYTVKNILPNVSIFRFFLCIIILFQLYVYYSFSSRTFLGDYMLHLQKDIPQLTELPRKTLEVQQLSCPKCKTIIEQLDLSDIKENAVIFCPSCGEKIMRYELIDLSDAELLSQHQKIIEKLDHQSGNVIQ